MSGTKPLTLARSAITTLRSTQRRSRQTEAKGKFAEVHSEASAGNGAEFGKYLVLCYLESFECVRWVDGAGGARERRLKSC